MRCLPVAVAAQLLLAGCDGGPAGSVPCYKPRPGGECVTGAGVGGRVVDENGKPLPDTDLIACTPGECMTGKTSEDGRFGFFAPKVPWQTVIKTFENVDASPRRGEAMVPIIVSGSQLLELGDVRVPAMQLGVELDLQSSEAKVISVGDGLQLTVRGTDLQLPLTALNTDLAARQVPVAKLAKGLYGNGKLVAVYAILPCGVTSKSPVAVRFPSPLPAGSAVTFHSIGLLDGALSAPQPGRADGKFVATDPGAGLAELTWLIVAQP